MRILTWIVRIILFLALFLFALKNTDRVILHLYFDQVWETPLILALLVFFAVGAAVGVLAMLTTIFRQRRQIARLQRELRDRPAASELAPASSDVSISPPSDL